MDAEEVTASVCISWAISDEMLLVPETDVLPGGGSDGAGVPGGSRKFVVTE